MSLISKYQFSGSKISNLDLINVPEVILTNLPNISTAVGVQILQEDNSNVILAVYQTIEGTKLYKTTDKGITWLLVEAGISDAPSDGFLYGRQDGDWEQINISGGISIISLTYTELKNLRDNGQLVPGQSYRITDYITTTTQANTQSAGNVFDIIVTSLDENTLSENASAVQHNGDTYFANAKLEAWEIKYCINNDTSRFAWADTVNDKGVIYYMKDEWGNECPYDFKNIQYLKNDVWVYTFGGTTDNSLTGGCHHNTMMGYMSNSILTLNLNTFGVSCYYNTFGVSCYYNTFGDNCYSNTFGNGCYSNTFGNGCYYNTFGNNFSRNTFGNNCQSNTFGNDCNFNTFGGGCQLNTFGDNCASNTFGDGCDSNTFGDGCYSNRFGDNCGQNTFDNNCGQNTFGVNCYFNTFGDYCSSNTFGNYCSSNTFGDYCSSNTFGNDCYYNTFGNDCNYNTFGNYCYTNTFGNNCDYNTFGSNCHSNTFYHGTLGTTKKDYLRYIILEDGVRNNNFYSDVTTSSESYLQRIRIKGLENTTPIDTQITLSSVNTKYEWLVAKDSSGIVQQYCPEDHNEDILDLQTGKADKATTLSGYGIPDVPNDNKTYGRLNGDWSEIDTSGGGGGVSMISITWSELKSLRDAGTLVPGQLYRITDYTTTTVQTDTQSAGHDFDVIVTALSTNELSENAKCVRKAGDTYFENAKLEAWELKYCIDNDTNRFAWADNVNGKGVIYYMKDEWGNECPYDFKNIQYLKNSVWVYTFGGTTDNSLVVRCSNNKINPYISSNKQTLNNITFGTNCYSNKFGNDCRSNTFGNYCYSNKFGNDCRSNTFGNYCNSNTFGNYCYSNTFGNYCKLNTFGNYCCSNNFYHGISGTIKKSYIRYITLEDGVHNNNFYSDVTTSSSSYLQRIRIKGLENNTPTDTQINTTANNKFEWVVCYTSGGVLKQYCPND